MDYFTHDGSGWITWDGDGLRAEAKVGVTGDHRIRFVEVRVSTTAGGQFVSSDALRMVPITSMLTWANMDPVRRGILEMFNIEVDSQDDLPAPPKRKPPIRFDVPASGGRKPDVFYERVARAYIWLVTTAESRRPASELAEANDVPVSTVHRWIREARRRGLLQPGVAGRVGA